MIPRRGFLEEEFKARLTRAQVLMSHHNIDALLLSTEPDIRYFTGFLTRFWESPTRPWFLLLPQSGKPVAIIPSIGANLMGSTWIEDIRTWDSPAQDEVGISLLIQCLKDIAGSKGSIGIPSGPETHFRVPLQSYHRITDSFANGSLRDDAGIVRRLRMVKSKAEIEKIKHACSIAGRAFDAVPNLVGAGTTLESVFRSFQAACLESGADWVSYLAIGADRDGYADVISPANEKELQEGDILMLDTGVVWDGYFCDYNRNFAIGNPSELASDAHRKLMHAVHAAQAMAKPGIKASDLFHAMNKMVAKDEKSPVSGRMGHGVGMQLTEWPSLMATDDTPIEEGMVLTLEPVIETADGKIMVHEENIVITSDGSEYLSALASNELTQCEA